MTHPSASSHLNPKKKNAPVATASASMTPGAGKPEEYQLSNGIPVIFQSTSGMVSATYWWVRTGSCDESPEEAGFAHFLEHMLFKDAAAKDTGKASTGQTAREIESLGGDINAYTSFDQTVYHVTCAAHQWERVLDVFGTMARPQRFLKEDFEREREVILEELKKNEDSPGRQLFQSLFTETFSAHPYGKPVIGYVKTLKKATVATLERFYRKSYVPENMGLILVGPYDDKRKQALLKQLERHFGSKVIRKGIVKKHPRKTEQLDRQKTPVIKRGFDVKTPTLAFAFRAPDLRHADVPALDIACQVLATGELSRFYQKLFYEKALATEVSGGMYIPSDPGMCWFQADLESLEQVSALAEGLFTEIARLRDEGPTEDELKRVIVNAESEKLYAMQSADGLAGRIGFLKYVMGDLSFDREYLDQLKSVDGARIQQVLKDWFHTRRMSVVLLLPKEQEKKFDISPVARLADKILGRGATAVARPAKTASRARTKDAWIPADPVTFTHSSGIRVLHTERPNSNCFSVHVSAFGGTRLELAQPIESAEKDWGASNLLAQTWAKGTCTERGSRDSRAIAAIVEGSAASLEGFAGRNTIGLQVTGLLRDWNPLTSLLGEVLVSPSFEESEVEHSRRVTEDSLKSIDDHSAQLCTKLFLETIFEQHPYGKLTYGSVESIKAISSQKLRAFHHRWIRPDQLSIAVAGRVRRSQLDELLDRLLGEFEAAEKAAKAAGKSWISTPSGLLTQVPEEPTLKGPRWVEKRLGREQTHIIVGGLGIRVGSEERWALRVLQNILGGQSGRLFIELREKKSLAYTVAPTGMEGVERGWIGTYIACSPSKKDEALQGIRQVLETMAAKGPTASELKRAREFYLGRRAMDQQSDGSTAAGQGLEHLYGIPGIGERHVIEAIDRVTAKTVQDFCRKYLVEPHQVTSIVG